MTVNYTTLLGLAQPVTGTEANTWGDVVNDEITALIEEAIAGGETIDVTANNVTLTDTDGAANQARNAILLITGTPGTTRNVVAPSTSKVYIVRNGSDAAVTIKGSATTGVSVPVGGTSVVFWNGSDFQTNESMTEVIVGAGAVGTPSITTAGDTNTGIFFPAADTIAFAEGGAEAMRINSSGNVGIGTNAPSFVNGSGLQISRTGAPSTLKLQRTDGIVSEIYSGGAGFVISADPGNTVASTSINFQVDGTERMRIDSSGNLGIGTSSPVALLTASNSGALTLDSNDGDETGFALFCAPSTITLNTVNSAIGFGSTAGRKYAAIGMQTYADTDQNGLNFYVQSTALGSSATLTEAMRIDSSGNVGIGTNAPLVALNVNGTDGELIRISTTADAGVQQEPALGFCTNVLLTHPATKISSLEFDASDNRASLLFYTRGVNTDTAPTERMRIDSSGNVGIGTSNPARLLTVSNTSTTPVLSILASTTGVCQLAFGDADDDNAGRIEYDNSVNAMTFGTSATERMRITSDGYLRMASGTGGIQFGGDTAAANALDDYEEGTWTPVIADASTGGNASVTTPTSATYTKIGNLVNVQCFFTNVSTVGLTAGNDIFIRGFPFTALSVSGTTFVPGSIIAQQITFSGYLTPYITDNNTFGRIAENTTGAVADFILVSEFSTGATDFYMSLTYQAA